MQKWDQSTRSIRCPWWATLLPGAARSASVTSEGIDVGLRNELRSIDWSSVETMPAKARHLFIQSVIVRASDGDVLLYFANTRQRDEAWIQILRGWYSPRLAGIKSRMSAFTAAFQSMAMSVAPSGLPSPKSSQRFRQRCHPSHLSKCLRMINTASCMIGFWRGFRGDELARMRVEHVQARVGEVITIFLPQSKGDRGNLGATYETPALRILCPVEAYARWIEAAGLIRGPVFRSIDRWGNLSEKPLNPNSLIPMLRRVFSEAGLPPEMYSGHSLRRGFATWASANGWDIKALMNYVGWKDMKSALRYVDPTAPFSGLALRQPATINYNPQEPPPF